MECERYLSVQTQIFALAAIVREMPLSEFLAAIERANTLGPILDPTLWMRGSSGMQKVGRLAGALLQFKSAVDELDVDGRVAGG